MEHLSKCPLCNNNKISKKFDCIDFIVSGKVFGIYQCDNCRLMFTNPRPDDIEINDYYKSDNYVVHAEKKNNIINYLFLVVRKISIKRKFEIVKKYDINKKILDIGCGTGTFLAYCKNKGMEIAGIEPSELARNIALQKYKLNNIYSVKEFNFLHKNYYGIITLWHVLEHVHNIDEYLNNISNLLSKDGTLIIALPNPDSYDAYYYSNFWAAYDVPRHLYHFNKNVIENLLANYNFNLIKVLPLKFDSYYISMLSEKYKYGRIKLIKPFIIGFISNLKARKKNNYSSLIYIFKKKDKE